MRVSVTRWISRSFHLLALPASVVLSSMVLGSEGSQTMPQTDSMPTSNLPLPLVSSSPSQKASCGAFSGIEIHPLSCNFSSPEVRTGSQKPAFHAEIAGSGPARREALHSVSLVQVAEFVPTPVPRPNCVAFQSDRAGTEPSSAEGNRKSGGQSPPKPGEIAMVKWEAQLSGGGSKIPMSREFAASDCPTIPWVNFRTEDYLTDGTETNASGASSSVAQAEASDSVSGKARLTSIPNPEINAVPSDVLKELSVLTPSQEQVSVGNTYLADLDELLQGQSNWLFGNEEIVDLAPSEPEAATGNYLDELNSLASKSGIAGPYRNTSFGPQETGADQRDERKGNFPIVNPYVGLEPEEACYPGNTSQKSLVDFFRPVSEISVSGVSSQPPSRSEDDSKLLPRPKDRACKYLDNSTLIAYHIPPRFGGSRPSRNTLKLCHNPLYYEDPNLERCGQSYGCLTTAASVVHFSTAIAMTPFKMSQNCPRDCVQALPDCPTCHKFGKEAYCSGR